MTDNGSSILPLPRALAYTAGIVRFNLLVLVAGAALLASDQGQDVLISLAEDLQAGHRHSAVFFLAVFFWAGSIWLWARTLLDVDFGDAPDCGGWLLFWRRHLPRVLGATAFVAVAWAFWLARDGAPPPLRPELGWMIAKSVVLGVVFWLLVYFRRRLSRWGARRLAAPAVHRVLDVPEMDEGYPARRLRGVLRGLWGAVVIASILLGAVLFVLSWRWPVGVGGLLGALVLLMVWGATWLPLGSLVTYLSNRSGLPLLSLLLLAALVFSLWNDNHEITHAAEPVDVASRPALNEALDQWLVAHPGGGREPLVVVATAGGGIRAAYWTATVLGALQDQAGDDPPFDDRLFAVSGVSGGSVGATIYRAVLSARRAASGPLPCGSGVSACAQAVLSKDLLGPPAAALLYPDLVQRFLPLPLMFPDRGRAVELGWEEAFREVTGSDRLERSLLDLYRADGRPWPALFLNATWVANGRRIVASNLRLPEPGGTAAVDQLSRLGRDLPLSTAAHNSARFPGVSPAGTWRDPDTGAVRGRLVDGGYFENFGADTAWEVLEALRTRLGVDFERRVLPVVVSISSDPGLGRDLTEVSEATPIHWAYEVRAPLRTSFRTREARGVEAFERLRRWTASHAGEFFHLRMCSDAEGRSEPPLGWALSKVARERIGSYLAADGGTPCSRENHRALTSILELLGP